MRYVKDKKQIGRPMYAIQVSDPMNKDQPKWTNIKRKRTKRWHVPFRSALFRAARWKSPLNIMANKKVTSKKINGLKRLEKRLSEG